MIIKKFIGKTEAEAIEAAKKDLGESVVIMNVKTIKKKGIFSIFRGQLIEVTVALEEETPRVEVAQKEVKATPILTPDIPPVREKSDTVALEEKLDSLQSLLEKQLQKPEAVYDEIIDKEESGEKIKDKVQNEVDDTPSEMVKFMKVLYNTMLDNEVDEKYVNQIMEEIEKIQKPNMPFDFALAGIYQKMILKFGQAESIKPAKSGPKVAFFIGPTGVGKTTTIAKIASTFCVDEKKKIALLTADTYRIAAAEQLRTYANILEVPFKIIYTIEEMQEALKEYEQYDYILVDTAGHSHQNEKQKDNMSEFVNSVDGIAEKEVFLVLSATTKYRDLLNIVDSYKENIDYKLIFTKLDETSAFGNLLNVKLHTGVALSYVTCGQNVPDDIETFNPQKTVKQLLGGKK